MPEPLKVERVSISSILPDPANARVHPQRNIEAIMGSLRRFGQQKPLVVDSDGIVRAGNGTLAAARALGWTDIDVVRTKLRGADAVAYALADNRTSDLADWDMAALASIAKELDDELLLAAGFTRDDVAPVVEVDGPPAAEWQGMPEFDQPDGVFRTIHLHFRDQAAVDEFARLLGQPIIPTTRYLWHPKLERESGAAHRFVTEPEDAEK